MRKQVGRTDGGLSRRTFLKGAGIGALGVAAAGPLVACSNSSNAASADSATQIETSWRTPPEIVADFAEEYDADVCICGMGYAGVTACRELAEEGYKAILFEVQPEDTYGAQGNMIGCVDAAALRERGLPEINKVEFFNNWMMNTNNYANQELVMKFIQNCGNNVDWYLSELTDEDMDSMTVMYWPKYEHQMDQIGVHKFWPHNLSFYGSCSQTTIQGYNRKIAEENGAQFIFGTDAQYVIMENGKVTGCVGKNDNGYIKVNCKAVVLSTGGFGGNFDMMADLMPDMAGCMTPDEEFYSMEMRNGRGIQMALWAGGKLESWPVPGMCMKHYMPKAMTSTTPWSLWLDKNGNRFCNEYYPVIEHRGREIMFHSREKMFLVFDSKLPEYAGYIVPQHGAYVPSENNLQTLREEMDKAVTKLDGTYTEAENDTANAGQAGPEGSDPYTANYEYVVGHTLEELANNLGLDGTTKENFLASIERYNQMCEQGVDEDFGRDPEVLFPVLQEPFFAVEAHPSLGATMTTMGGVLTDAEQNVLDENYEPIPGLYCSGNSCGRRFGSEYFTPIPGVSLGMVITLGRECGKSVGSWLKKNAQ